MHELAQVVLHYIRKHDLLRAGDRVGVAVSGGADSVSLLRILLELRSELGLVLSVVHFNHKLRGSESDQDEEFVRELAGRHELPFLCEYSDVTTHANSRKLSVETAARQLRYEFFNKFLKDRELDKIATAHTLDDQAETVLLKLVRGAGTRGLAGIYPKVAVSPRPSASSQTGIAAEAAGIVRPLLWTRREAIRSYLAETRQSWREDSSNSELRHRRNFVRHEIVPRLEQNLNPCAREALAEAAEIARLEEDFWSQLLTGLLPQVWLRNDQGGALRFGVLRTWDLAVQRRLVRAAAESLNLNLEFRQVEEILGLKDGRSASIGSGWSAQLVHEEIRFGREIHETSDYEYEMRIPGKVIVPEAGVAIDICMASATQAEIQELLDAKFVRDPLTLRNWRAGDRFWPAHTKAPKKIKELLQDRDITGPEKKTWPVVASGGEIVWVRGFGVRRDYVAKNGEGILIRDTPLVAEK